MKFTDYLESVLLNELFNIKKQNIALKKIKLNENSKNFHEIIDDWILERDITTPSDVLSIDFNDSSLLDFMNSKIKKNFLSILFKIKNNTHYVEVKKSYFIFRVADMLYFLNLKEDDGYTEIIFDKYLGRREEQFRSNSLMKISGAKDELFNKIAAIIKNEYKGSIKTKVFSFKASLDEHEDVLSDVKFFLQTFQNQFENYVAGKKIDLSDLQKTLLSFDNKTKNLLKNYLSNKSDRDYFVEFLNSVFSSKIPKPPTKILPFYKNKLFDKSEVESLVMEKSMRVRLYKEVIRAILGPKASIKQKGIETLFSLKEIK